MRMRPAFLVLACACVLALAASGCGGGGESYSGTKPDAWASTVCGALSDWVQGLEASSARLGNDLRKTKDLKSVKARFVVFLRDAERSAGTMIANVKGAGRPAVMDGAAIQRDLVFALERARESFVQAVKSAKELSTRDLPSFSNGVGVLSGKVQRELASTGDDFNELSDKYDDEAFNEAIDEEPACEQLSPGTS